MTSHNDITGDTIATKPASDACRENISKIDWSVKRTDPPTDCDGSQHAKPATRMVFIGWIDNSHAQPPSEKLMAGHEILHSRDVEEYEPYVDILPVYAEIKL